MQHISEIIKDVMDKITRKCNNCNRRFHRNYLEIDVTSDIIDIDSNLHYKCKDIDECNEYKEGHTTC